jgi:2-amino-4-hydroxy-6-hydroxymethyldihydropteridine diphosphokinase
MRAAASIDLPSWARVSPSRAEHIARVTALLMNWADLMGLDQGETDGWRDAGRWHDALRDAPEAELRALTGDVSTAAALLHGPAAAIQLARDGEQRSDVLEAIAHHTVGHPAWARTGRALYMADYLEPGRPFGRVERARLADQVPRDFDGTFREVARHRLGWARREGVALHPQTLALWESIQ